MSYPLTLQPLVIEDNDDIRDAYKIAFEAIAAEFPAGWPLALAPPCFAFSAEEGLKEINRSKIFHIVILDLGLPEKDHGPDVEDVDLGLGLMERCIEREQYPIPALLVISGHVGSTDQVKIQDRLRENFWYGRLIAKGNHDLLENHIRQACREALRYVGVGIHLRDAGEGEYPTLSPRDEDLLRRSVLQQPGSIGVDLNWWSARRSPEIGGVVRLENVWTKVLMGRYIFDEGRGASRPKFFKLLAGPDSQSVIESARRVEQKLTHVKITSTVVSRSTGLIVTEKVGAQDARPKQLVEIFDNDSPADPFQIAGQIAGQVHQLGDLFSDRKAVKSLLWSAHDKEGLVAQWKKIEPGVQSWEGVPVADPIGLLGELTSAEDKVRLKERALVHGDLHISNVALDQTSHGFEAYIFDPGVIKRATAGRDLAVLEVSVLLHQQVEVASLVEVCRVIYDPNVDVDANSAALVTQATAQKLIHFICGLREGAQAWNSREIYALLVFDFVLVQLGASLVGSSGSKTVDHRAVGCVLAFVTEWYRGVARGRSGQRKARSAASATTEG